ncbi:PREDICTED: ras-related protein Rab-43-like [Amphimedon queenslandica]|uniref:Uncharacterized protein n=1 Tax=Amphimedon queenslandica TaxID=400682 RepID=A0A1X7U7Y4_AMPQE|nr:PREDICTED: ras-related protein Rab-43-like [Amphimedon queenslandica]|eukprot:XP_011405854.1 PREDICTED: ras-related protein Rab-43-like [Amphimedon queenslandica]
MAARYKVVLVGDKDVGKTSLFHRVLFGYFKDTDEENRSTLGFDCFEKSFSALGDLVEVELNDSPGKTRFETHQISSLYRSSNAVLLVYSVEDFASFSSLRCWMEECRYYMNAVGHHNILWVLVGNKSDLESDITPEMVEDFVSEMEIEHSFVVSAKTGDGVEEMFEKVIEVTHEMRLNSKVNVDPDRGIKLSSEETNRSNPSFCYC